MRPWCKCITNDKFQNKNSGVIESQMRLAKKKPFSGDEGKLQITLIAIKIEA